MGNSTPNYGHALLAPYMGLFPGFAEPLFTSSRTLSQGGCGASPQPSQAEQG